MKIITITDPYLLPVSCCFLKQSLLMSKQKIVFNKIPVEDSISLLNSFNFPSLRYLFNDISWTLRRCHCSRIFIPATVLSTIFIAGINRFDFWQRGIISLVFSVRKPEIDPDSIYHTWLNQIFDYTPAFCNTLLSASIKSAFRLELTPAFAREQNHTSTSFSLDYRWYCWNRL